MKRFVEGADRGQSTLFPECLDDWIDENNPVRVIDGFVDTLALSELGFEGVEPAETGRPAYHPSVLLKLYIYGYLNRVQSSRRLEREAGRNVELMWLLGRLVPDHKTVADFRKDNGRAIGKVCPRFVELCREMVLRPVNGRDTAVPQQSSLLGMVLRCHSGCLRKNRPNASAARLLWRRLLWLLGLSARSLLSLRHCHLQSRLPVDDDAPFLGNEDELSASQKKATASGPCARRRDRKCRSGAES